MAVGPRITALAPLLGALNCTVAPATALFWASRTTAVNVLAKSAPTMVDCRLPATTSIVLGGPAELVKEKDVGSTEGTDADTV